MHVRRPACRHVYRHRWRHLCPHVFGRVCRHADRHPCDNVAPVLFLFYIQAAIESMEQSWPVTKPQFKSKLDSQLTGRSHIAWGFTFDFSQSSGCYRRPSLALGWPCCKDACKPPSSPLPYLLGESKTANRPSILIHCTLYQGYNTACRRGNRQLGGSCQQPGGLG